MAYVELERATSLSPAEAFARITDWESHRVPFTRIRRTAEGFIARTGVGPFGFDDPMQITRFEPPHRVDLVKRGRIVRGWATIEIISSPHPSAHSSAAGSIVRWREELSFPFLPVYLERIAARIMLNHLLSGLIGRRR